MAALALTSGCVAPGPVRAPAPPRAAVPPVAVQQPAPPPPRPSAPVIAAPVDWRDATLAEGIWRYRPLADGSLAVFVAPGGQTLLSLRCNRPRTTVTLIREGVTVPGTAPVPATISASTQQQRLTASATQDGLAIALNAQDRLLDALAFSRGRFAVDIYGTAMLVVPAWSEVARVVEDCR